MVAPFAKNYSSPSEQALRDGDTPYAGILPPDANLSPGQPGANQFLQAYLKSSGPDKNVPSGATFSAKAAAQAKNTIERQIQSPATNFSNPLHKRLGDDFMKKYLNGVDRGLIERDKFIAADMLIPLTTESAAAAINEKDPNTVGKFPNQGVQVG
jgi:hypothetical protein